MFLKNNLFICTKFVKDTFWTLIDCSLRFVTLDSTRKIRPISSLHRNDCLFFSKNSVFHILLGLKEMIHQLPQYLLEYLLDTRNCSTRIVTLDNTNKNRPKFFFIAKIACFFKTLCFQQPLRCYRNDHIGSKITVKKPSGPSTIVPQVVSYSIIRGKVGQKLSSPWKQLFFEMFVSIDLLCF